MDVELGIICAVQIIVLALVVSGIVVYLMRHLMFRSRHDVSQKTLLVTGCDSGLGFELARHFHQMGFRVYAGFSNPAGEGAVRMQTEASSRLHILHLDVTSAISVENAAKTIADQLPESEKGLWAVVNAATHCVCGELLWQTWQHCDKQIQINFIGLTRTIRAFLPLLKPCEGRIINVGSLAGEEDYPQPGLSIFTGTKQAVEGLSRALRRELSRHKVDVSVVRPDAATVEKFLFQGHHRNMNEMWDQMTPELRLENQDIFIAYHDRVAKEGIDIDDRDVCEDSPTPLLSDYLLASFEDALLSKRPYETYVAIPTCWVRFKLSMTRCLPSGCRQYFVQHKYMHNVSNILKV